MGFFLNEVLVRPNSGPLDRAEFLRFFDFVQHAVEFDLFEATVFASPQALGRFIGLFAELSRRAITWRDERASSNLDLKLLLSFDNSDDRSVD